MDYNEKITIKEKIIKSSVKSKLFIGEYKEKRFCEDIKTYRDVIIIDAKLEKEFSSNLEHLLAESSSFEKNQFVGITKNEDDYTLWTEIDEETPFGKYWFQVKTVKFRFNEIQIKLKKLRPVQDSESAKSFAEKLRESTRTGNDSPTGKAVEQWWILYEFWKTELSALAAWILSISINRQSITETLRFVSLVIVSLFAGSTKIVKYFLIFLIKLIERTTWLAHVLTPYALGLFDLLSKIVGGLYLLICMIWKDSVGNRRPTPNAIEFGPPRSQQAIRYNNNQ